MTATATWVDRCARGLGMHGGVVRRVRPVGLLEGAIASVTVVIPCYNYGHFLPFAVASAREQSGVKVNVVIVDDASPDGSGDVATALAAERPDIRVVRHEQNKGHIATYRDGLEAVTGEYCALVSADDLLTPGCLALAVAVMERHPGVGFVYGHPRNFSGDPPDDNSTHVGSWTLWPGQRWIAGRCRTARNPVYSPEVVVRTSVQRLVGPYEPSLPHTADLEMWLRMAAVADVARVNGPVQALRRVHGANMSETKFASAVDDLVERAAAFDYFFTHAGRRLDGAPRLHQRATARLVLEILDQANDLRDAGAPVSEVAQVLEAARRLDARRLHRAWGAEAVLDGPAGAWRSVIRAKTAIDRGLRRRMAWQTWQRAGL